MKKVEILGLTTVPEIQPGDQLADIITTCAREEVGGIQEKDILIVTSKIVSKAENSLAKLSAVRPGKEALKLSRRTGKAASKVQLILDNGQRIIAVIPLAGLAERYILRCTSKPEEARRLLEQESCILLTRDKDGRLHTYDGGIDSSNHPEDTVSLPPSDPDRSAREIREETKRLTGKEVAVIIADTEVVPFGSMDLAIGSSGIETVAKRFGEPDRFGKPKFGGMDVVVHELAAAAALLFGQTREGIPVAIVRGLDYRASDEENVANTLVADGHQLRRAFVSAVRATARLLGLRGRLFSWLLGLFARA